MMSNPNNMNRAKALIAKHLTEIILKETKDPKIGFVSVNEVEVSSDLGVAKVYVSFLGTKNKNENLKHLVAASGYIRSSLAKVLKMKKTPELRFFLDDSFDKYEHLNELLKH